MPAFITRDALFLSSFSRDQMPLMVLVCSACNFPASQVLRQARSFRRRANRSRMPLLRRSRVSSDPRAFETSRFASVSSSLPHSCFCASPSHFRYWASSTFLQASIAHVQAGIAAQASIAAALAYVWSEIAIGSFYHIFWEISGLAFDAQTSKKAYALINFGSTAATLFIGLVGVLTPAVCASAAAASRSPGC